MAKKNKKSAKKGAPKGVDAFDAIDVKSQGQMLDALKDALGYRQSITSEERESLNISRQLQKLGNQVLADQAASEKTVRKQKDIKKDFQLQNISLNKPA